ncbi:hypothetical protein H7F10_13075 [Acidithiobacillus sp. HP-6]|uniref:hypothetical protein n=1 Tax=unclassified Acidithiobacillus TaxID=2614800 RepID=UPI00187A4EC6|nr:MULTISPECIES: hypothetical protein [unclassified Acidithiobacillus]MBE7563862.1 hypothetical protein [Acidithiobacillus sp. HP-6]MBE7567983.1 hypothetical protein [Acidithiobacillus sp. HP-11]MBE7570393.1 hypothetical protein [Acidithiobacillus sp. HP-2]
MDKLTELIADGPDKRYTMKSVVLSRYEDINTARKLMRTWNDIADALGFTGRGKDVAGCYARVSMGIKKGKLMVPVKKQKTSIGRGLDIHERLISKSGIINLDDPANQ